MTTNYLVLTPSETAQTTIRLGVEDTSTTVIASAVQGTTLAALTAGSTSYKLVAAIEGVPYLISDGDPAKVVQAWSSSDYQVSYPGLYVDLDNQQSLDPWNPFGGGGGNCTLRIQADSTDRIGIDTSRVSAGVETTLTASVDRNATAIQVNTGSAFATGDAYIGTECITIGSANPTSLTVTARGKYSPFASGGTGGSRFAEHHRVTLDPQMVRLAPVVSQQPRVWIGKWCGVWMHKVDGTGLLNSKSDAQCVFAGRIAGIADDAETGFTCIELEHVLDVVKDASIGRDMYSAVASRSIPLATGQTFTMLDHNGTVWRTATALSVVASGASGANQINAGYYTLDQILTAINAWLASELTAGRLWGVYSLVLETQVAGPRTTNHWYIAGAAGATGSWFLTFPTLGIATAIGKLTLSWSDSAPCNSGHGPPADVAPGSGAWAAQNSGITITNPRGTFVDSYALLPASIKPSSSGGLQWALLLLDDKDLLLVSLSPGSTIFASNVSIAMPDMAIAPFDATVEFPLGTNRSIRQLLCLSGSFATVTKMLMYGTGTVGFNSSTYDLASYGLGLGLPGGILGTAFESSLDNLPGAGEDCTVLIDEPTKFSEVMGGDLLFRRAFPLWKQGGLRFGTFVTPTTEASVGTLTESNKAEPAGSTTSHRSATIKSTEWARDIVKIDYDRDFTASKGDQYLKTLTFEDATAVDDSGGTGRPFTIKARNQYQFSPSAGYLTLSAGLLATMPMFSRPIRRTTRSISIQHFEAIAVGDVVLVQDAFARDPVTGMRGITTRPALVTKHRYNPGGPTAGNPTSSNAPTGEVDLVFLDLNRLAPYAPCAEVDSTAATDGFTAGYNSATKTIRCLQHEHTIPDTLVAVGPPSLGVTIAVPQDVLDASYFVAGYPVRIIQVDPDTTTSYVSWSDTIASVSGSDITLTAGGPFDSTKGYRIVFDTYSADLAVEQAFAFQAGSTSSLIEGVASPYQYGSQGVSISYPSNATTDLAELHADIGALDGRPRDTGYERGAIRLLNRLCDSKTAHQSPMLSNTVLTNTTYSAGSSQQLLSVSPIFLTRESYSASVTRLLTIAPFFRSSDGTRVLVRVTLCTDLPTDSTINDVTRLTPFADATWSTTSTTWQTGNDVSIPMTSKHQQLGLAWILIEGTIKCETRGLAKCIETVRQAT